MSKNIEINYKSDVGYEVLYPIIQTSSLLPGTLSGQFVFDTAPKSNVAASADDELLRLGEGRSEIESYWLERYPWTMEISTGIMSQNQSVTVQLIKDITNYMMIAILCYYTNGIQDSDFIIDGFNYTFTNFVILFPFKENKFAALGGRIGLYANGFSQLRLTAKYDDVILRVYTF